MSDFFFCPGAATSRQPRCKIKAIVIEISNEWGGGIFTIKIPFFSGETAEKGMGVYGFDCPAIFWDQECSTFWGVLEGVLEH